MQWASCFFVCCHPQNVDAISDFIVIYLLFLILFAINECPFPWSMYSNNALSSSWLLNIWWCQENASNLVSIFILNKHRFGLCRSRKTYHIPHLRAPIRLFMRNDEHTPTQQMLIITTFKHSTLSVYQLIASCMHELHFGYRL